MALSLNTLKAPAGLSNKKRIRRGRGDGSGYGSYSGRGTKGQTSRSGSRSGSGRMARKGMRKRLMSMPKLGGFTSLYEKMESVNVAELERHFDAGATVNPSVLLKKGLIRTPRYGVKVLGAGATKKKLMIVDCSVSASARQKIEAAGGSVK